MIEITLEGKQYELEEGAPYAEAVRKHAGKKDVSILALRINDTIVDLSTPATSSAIAEPIRAGSEEGIAILRHSAAHIMAEAVLRLFPDAKVTIGPSIKDGFYYDFDIDPAFTPDDLSKIEAEMKKIVKLNAPFTREEMSKADAVAKFAEMNEPYKVEIINDLGEETVSLYTQGEFVDLCRGPHIPHTGYLKAYKLMSVAGAYWRGDEKNKMLSRIYGTAFPTREELDAYLKRMKEARERDHRKLGKDLDLFSFHEEGPGFPFWHANGMVLYKNLETYIREENERRGYEEIRTPTILNEELWHRSGHWDNFRENMYFTDIDGTGYSVKPMNCPGGLLVYKTQLHSYRDLPIRNAELGLVHRHELSGVLHGLFRVRAFTQDDAHIFCTEEQLVGEIKATIEYTLDVYRTFGFEEFTIYIATRPDKAIGSVEVWDMATDALKSSLSALGLDYKIKEGEGAFYGPKIEFNIKDVLERNWQCGTIQVDFSMPARFDITYEGGDGERHTPVMLHRAIFGSLERFIGILVEHYNGKFPLWLAPTQVALICVGNSDTQIAYAKEVSARLKERMFRTSLDTRNESLGYKIRHWRLMRVPYTIIIGDDEVAEKNVSLRLRSGVEKKSVIVDTMIEALEKEQKERMNASLFEEGGS